MRVRSLVGLAVGVAAAYLALAACVGEDPVRSGAVPDGGDALDAQDAAASDSAASDGSSTDAADERTFCQKVQGSGTVVACEDFELGTLDSPWERAMRVPDGGDGGVDIVSETVTGAGPTTFARGRLSDRLTDASAFEERLVPNVTMPAAPNAWTIEMDVRVTRTSPLATTALLVFYLGTDRALPVVVSLTGAADTAAFAAADGDGGNLFGSSPTFSLGAGWQHLTLRLEVAGASTTAIVKIGVKEVSHILGLAIPTRTGSVAFGPQIDRVSSTGPVTVDMDNLLFTME